MRNMIELEAVRVGSPHRLFSSSLLDFGSHVHRPAFGLFAEAHGEAQSVHAEDVPPELSGSNEMVEVDRVRRSR